MPFEGCFKLNPTGDQSFRGSLLGLDIAYCDFTVASRTQIRAYRWCSPPRIGCAITSPNRSIARVQGASFPSET
jgi:hypothetical protein